MMIHAGGYSQRLPNQSILGKVFLTLPCGEVPMQMLDALLMMYVDIPEKMNAGVFVAASDVIFLYNGKGEWDFKSPGFTAIAHPASVSLAKNHGVFVLEDMKSPWESYQKDLSKPSAVATPKFFVHKQTEIALKDKKAIIPETDLVYVDLAYYMDTSVMYKLVKFYADIKPLQCEIDAYGDFLQALGPGAPVKCCRETSETSTDQQTVREQVFDLLKGTPLHIVIFHEAQFNHMGTVAEFLYHMCKNEILRKAYHFQMEGENRPFEDKASYKPKRLKLSTSESNVIMHSVVRNRNSSFIGAESVIEYCIVEKGVSVGRNCLLSNVHLPENSVIPEGTFIHTMVIKLDYNILYTTCVFGVNDALKKTNTRSTALELQFLHVPLASALEIAVSTTDILWPQNVQCNLWTAKLFPVCSSRKESCTAAIRIIKSIEGRCLHSVLRQYSQLVSMEDVLRLKSGTSMLSFHSELRSSIH